MILYLLFETAAGYALFEKLEFDAINMKLVQMQKSIVKAESFFKIVRLRAFTPFHNAEKAINNARALAEGDISDDLRAFLKQNLPESKKKKTFTLGILDKQLAANVAQEFGIDCQSSDEVIFELFRGIRMHFTRFINNKEFKEDDLEKAQLGLAHSFSRSKVKHDTNREDKHIIQSIALVELMDKNLNTFCMRLKEWYSWHFPELAKIVTDNLVYTKLVNLIQNKSTLTDEHVEVIEELVTDGEIAKQIVEASKTSMGQGLSEIDQNTIIELCNKILKHFEFRAKIQEFLRRRMVLVAPNLTSLIGENVGAKLISQAGSLTTLAKYPASTVQILGAEKALFRALKTKGNTPKYGLLYHSTFIGRAQAKDKGKISRYLANKCSLASRLDNFLINPTTKFGEKMREQVEQRLKFLADGDPQQKNEDVMEEVLNELKAENLYVESEKKQK